MNDRQFDRSPLDHTPGTLQAVAADVAGMLWSHSNPAELYRWISRRNDLLRTIADAAPRASGRPTMAS